MLLPAAAAAAAAATAAAAAAAAAAGVPMLCQAGLVPFSTAFAAVRQPAL